MPSSHGRLQWTEGGISVNDPLNDNLRVGMQIRMYQLGRIGGPNIEVDWASGDYKVNDQLGFRARKDQDPYGSLQRRAGRGFVASVDSAAAGDLSAGQPRL
jgi:hypothetical protein